MTILIKGMEMPKNCYECFCHEQVKAGVDHPAFGYCVLENWKQSRTPLTMTAAEAQEGIADWCPLIELPPHGRLIDADELLTDANKLRYGEGWLITVENIEAAPTIIEAEE